MFSVYVMELSFGCIRYCIIGYSTDRSCYRYVLYDTNLIMLIASRDQQQKIVVKYLRRMSRLRMRVPSTDTSEAPDHGSKVIRVARLVRQASSLEGYFCFK